MYTNSQHYTYKFSTLATEQVDALMENSMRKIFQTFSKVSKTYGKFFEQL